MMLFRPGHRLAWERVIPLLAASLMLITVGIALLHRDGRLPVSTAAPHATPTVDPRLVLHPRFAPVAGALTHGVGVRGTLYPALPGRNALRLTVHWHARRLRGTPMMLVATMPGMPMPPIRVTLVPRGDDYRATLALPMLGAYRARVTMDTLDGRATGALTLQLALLAP